MRKKHFRLGTNLALHQLASSSRQSAVASSICRLLHLLQTANAGSAPGGDCGPSDPQPQLQAQSNRSPLQGLTAQIKQRWPTIPLARPALSCRCRARSTARGHQSRQANAPALDKASRSPSLDALGDESPNRRTNVLGQAGARHRHLDLTATESRRGREVARPVGRSSESRGSLNSRSIHSPWASAPQGQRQSDLKPGKRDETTGETHRQPCGAGIAQANAPHPDG